jgi:hypothetical protein
MSYDLAKAALLRVSEKCPGTKISGNPGLDEIKVKEEMMDYDYEYEDQPTTLFYEADVTLHNTSYRHQNEQNVFYQE